MSQNDQELKTEILTMVVVDIVSSSSLSAELGAFDARKTLEWFRLQADQRARTHGVLQMGVRSAYGLTDIIFRIQSFIRLAIGRLDNHTVGTFKLTIMIKSERH